METVRFDELDLYPQVLRAIKEMGFEEATPIQSQAIPVVMSGSDVIGQAQTGTGKTAAFGIPILQTVDPSNKKTQVIILSPTRELAIQVSEEIRKLSKYMHGVKILPVYGGQDINRQIKADNALLRELKATVKKLMQTVKNSVPAIAEAMEKLRGSMLIFSYQLRHIGIGKHNIGRRVKAIKPELERYTGLVQQIKAKSKECKNLLAEKKETPFYQIPKLHDLSRRIAELTEELEELNTEKEMLLRSLDCADDTGISSVKKDIAAMESALKKLEAQEAKYSAELDAALKEYSGLKEQASEFDAGELMEARLSIRGEKERSAVTRVQDAYGEKYDSLMMFDSKRDVANLLHEEAEAHSVRERLRQKQQTKTQRQRKPKHYEQER